MIGTNRYPRSEALSVANKLVATLEPYCERIVIAGSIRREKADVGDIELLFIPKNGIGIPRGQFLESEINLADQEIARLERHGVLSRRLSVTGGETWGAKNKLAVHAPSGIPVDFFSTKIENWWVSLVVRTGSKDTNLRLTTGAQHLGRSLNAYGCGVTDCRTGRVTTATSERDVFKLCGVPYIEPNRR